MRTSQGKKWLHGIFLFFFLLPQLSQGHICLRSPGVSEIEFQKWVMEDDRCKNWKNEFEEFILSFREENLDLLASQLRQEPLTEQEDIFRSYFENEKQHIWNIENAKIFLEVIHRWQPHCKDRKLREKLQQWELSLRKTEDLSENQVAEQSATAEAQPQTPEALIFKNGLRVSSPLRSTSSERRSSERTVSISSSEDPVAHWMVATSERQPFIFFGTQSEFLKAEKNATPSPWVSGDCKTPRLKFPGKPNQTYYILFPEKCVALRNGGGAVENSNTPLQSSLKTSTPYSSGVETGSQGGTTKTGAESHWTSSPWFWVGTAVTAIVIGAALQSKTLVIYKN